MSQLAIVLNDTSATPVAITFKPQGQDDAGVWWWSETPTTTSSSAALRRISAQYKQPAPPKVGESVGKRVERIKWTIWTPVMETLSNNTASGIAPVPQVAFIPAVTVEFVISERASHDVRHNLQAFMQQLQSNTQLTEMAINGQNLY